MRIARLAHARLTHVATKRTMSSTTPKLAVPNDFNKGLFTSLKEEDPEVYRLSQAEVYRQFRGLELIASENLTSRAVMEANGSFFTNKYSEGLPGARYYGGNEFVDELEVLAQKRALAAFGLDDATWGVNVQPYSGSGANFAAYMGLINPGDKLMGLALADGGHLTHGAFTPKRKISGSSIFFESQQYHVDSETGLLDYDALEKEVKAYEPKLLIAGASAYPRDWDLKRVKAIADSVGAKLLMDMAHISGLVAAKLLADPFEVCDVVTTTVHKTLRGPRAGLIFYRKDRDADLPKRIDDAVFPAMQGGPHNNTIAAVAVALKQVAEPSFKEYALQIVKNAQALANYLVSKGYKIQTDGTDNHIILWDLRPAGLTGNKVEKLAETAHITLNKNAVQGDKSAQTPGGVRLGTNALTSRSMKEQDMEKVGEFLDRLVQISLEIQTEAGNKLLKNFVAILESRQGPAMDKLAKLSEEVQDFATKFPLPGVPDTSLIEKVE